MLQTDRSIRKSTFFNGLRFASSGKFYCHTIYNQSCWEVILHDEESYEDLYRSKMILSTHFGNVDPNVIFRSDQCYFIFTKNQYVLNFLQVVKGMSRDDIPCQVFVRTIAKKPGLKETNFQVRNALFSKPVKIMENL